jgi:acetyl/propionyl-CoA carboxylase alpha subunit
MKYRYESRGQVFEITIERHEGGYRAILGSTALDQDPQPIPFEILDDQPGALTLRLGDQPVTVYWATEPGSARGRRWLSVDGCAYQLDKPLNPTRRASEQAAGNILRAPMPAQVRAIEITPGAYVHKGQTLLILEAMKMEMRLQAPHAGHIVRLSVSVGDRVIRDQVLIEMEE